MIFVVLLAILSAIVGTTVFAANPHRLTNRAFALSAFVMSAWLAVVAQIVAEDALVRIDGPDLRPWYRLNAAIAGFWPWSVWITKESLVSANLSVWQLLRRSVPWLMQAVILATLSSLDSFVIRDPTGAYHRGAPYLSYALISFSAQIWIIVDTHRQMRQQTGIRKVETQFLALNLCWGGLLGVLSIALGNFLHIAQIKWIGLLLFSGTYALTGWAFTVYRIFEARYVLLSLAQRVATIGVFSFSTVALFRLLEGRIPFEIVAAVAVTCAGGFWLDRKTRIWLGLDGTSRLDNIRREVITIAKTEPDPDRLVVRFESLLSDQFHATRTCLLFDNVASFRGNDIELRKDTLSFELLATAGWSTPESLQRRRHSLAINQLRDFLSLHRLAAIVASPRGSSTPSLGASR